MLNIKGASCKIGGIEEGGWRIVTNPAELEKVSINDNAPWFSEPNPIHEQVLRGPVYLFIKSDGKAVICITTSNREGDSIHNILGCGTGRAVPHYYSQLIKNLMTADSHVQSHLKELQESLIKEVALSESQKALICDCYPPDFAKITTNKAPIMGGGRFWSPAPTKPKEEKTEFKPEPKQKKKDEKREPKNDELPKTDKQKLENYKKDLAEELPTTIKILKLIKNNPDAKLNSELAQLVLDMLTLGINSKNEKGEQISIEQMIDTNLICKFDEFFRSEEARTLGIKTIPKLERIKMQQFSKEAAGTTSEQEPIQKPLSEDGEKLSKVAPEKVISPIMNPKDQIQEFEPQ